MFKTALIVSGILAFIAMAAPSLVVLGLFMLIIPGLILSLAPTVFVYLLVIAVIRMVLPIPPGPVGWVASVVLAAAIGWGAVQPMRQAETLRWRSHILPDVVPSEPLKLTGDIVLDFPSPSFKKREPIVCDHLCAALLDTPGVTGVIVGDGINRRRLRLVPHGTAPDPGIRPTSPESILGLFDKVEQKKRPAQGMRRRWEETKALQEAVAAEWKVRLNTRQTLVADPVGKDAKADWTVQASDVEERGDPHVQRLEIRDSKGEIRLRRSLVTHSIFAPFFAFDFVGGIENAHFRVARQMLSAGKRYASFDAPLEFLTHAVVARPAAPQDAPDALRETVIAALDDPAADAQRLLAVRDWLKHLGYTMSPEDQPLVVRIVEDHRIKDLARTLHDFLNDEGLPAFRHAFVGRIVDPATTSDDRGFYARWLARMPVGTFANPTPEERAIWADPRLFTEAAPFLERLADTGEPGLERLTLLIRQAANIPEWYQRRGIVREIRRGFARMGRAAGPALPTVLPLFTQRPSPLMQVVQEREEWNKTLLLMGLPIDQLPYPPNYTPEQVAKDRERALRDARTYDPDKRSGYDY